MNHFKHFFGSLQACGIDKSDTLLTKRNYMHGMTQWLRSLTYHIFSLKHTTSRANKSMTRRIPSTPPTTPPMMTPLFGLEFDSSSGMSIVGVGFDSASGILRPISGGKAKRPDSEMYFAFYKKGTS